jgi:hypothetical protein
MTSDTSVLTVPKGFLRDINEDESELAYAVYCWRATDNAAYERWLVKREVAPEWFQGVLDRHFGKAGASGRQQALLSEALGLTVYGWYDQETGEYHPSETMGPSAEKNFDRDEAYFVKREVFETDAQILSRWNKPNDEIDVLMAIRDDANRRDERMAKRREAMHMDAENDETFDGYSDGLNLSAEAVWTERMTAFREEQLHGLLTTYFGTTRYMAKEIVLQWRRNKKGKFVPAKKMYVGQWIAESIAGRLLEHEDGSFSFVGGSRLEGVTACCGFIRSKMARKMVVREGESFRAAYEKVVAA